MPSGLILTVLAALKFRPHERDDKALADTAATISVMVNPIFYVFNPVDTSEELTSRLTDTQKARFQDAISDLASDASEAVNQVSTKKASEIWREQLGDQFPLVEEEEKHDEKQQRKQDAASLATVYASRNPSKPWAGE